MYTTWKDCNFISYTILPVIQNHCVQVQVYTKIIYYIRNSITYLSQYVLFHVPSSLYMYMFVCCNVVWIDYFCFQVITLGSPRSGDKAYELMCASWLSTVLLTCPLCVSQRIAYYFKRNVDQQPICAINWRKRRRGAPLWIFIHRLSNVHWCGNLNELSVNSKFSPRRKWIIYIKDSISWPVCNVMEERVKCRLIHGNLEDYQPYYCYKYKVIESK